MKIFLQILLISSLFIGCSSNDDEVTEDTTPILVTKESQTTSNGDVYYYYIKYDGDKIVENVEDNTIKDVYTYSGDNIVKIVNYDGTVEKEIKEFSYSNDKLASVKVTNKRSEKPLIYTINYSYSNDVVKYKELYSYSYNPTTGQYTNLSFNKVEAQISNGNIVKINTTSDDPARTYTATSTMTYDNKNNPYMNIKGLLKINFVEGRDWVSKNNMTKKTFNYNSGSLSGFNNESIVYAYNNADYPQQKTTTYTSDSSPTMIEIYKFEYNK